MKNNFNIKVLKLRSAGMFSNVNEVVQQLYLAEQGGYQFAIDWRNSCYYDPEMPNDPWLYFFAPCFENTPLSIEGLTMLPGGVPIACSRNNIITPRLREGDCTPLLLPKDRKTSNRLIKAHIRPNKTVNTIVKNFRNRYFNQPVIGLHIRGPGRTDGGVPALRNVHKLTHGVPLDLYFNATEKAFQNYPDARVFVCSDSSVIIDLATERFGSRILTYNATRSPYGEMHANHPKNLGMVFPKIKLGLDVLVEALLLSQVNFFVHGNSNVVNFVLCNSPKIKNYYVY